MVARSKDEKVLELLSTKNISFAQLQRLLESKERAVKVVVPRKTARYRFGIVADTHLCDKACAVSELQDFYKALKKRGIKEVVHAGDLATGQNVYRGQEADLLCFGLDDHLQYCVENYPDSGMTTYFITGNHEGSYRKFMGVNFGKLLASQRDDLVYLGANDAQLTLNGVKIQLAHGIGSPAYAVSYKLQKRVELLGAGKKPQIYILGHYHVHLQMFYRNVHCFLGGAFQRPNDYSVSDGFPNMMGGWIVEIAVADDAHNSIAHIKTEFIPYYG